MKQTVLSSCLFFLIFVLCPGDVSWAVAEPVSDQVLVEKKVGFERFAQLKLQELDSNHKYARSRMEVTKMKDGTFRARYHQIDSDSLNVKVRRSQSSQVPFVGVLYYNENVYESSAKNPDAFDKKTFDLVTVIPNRQIFSYKKGAWR
jgi:hypothetical protein